MPSVDLFVGWGLGVLSTLGVEWYRRYRDGNELRSGLRNELWELRYRFATVVFTIRGDLGVIDRPTLLWVRSVVLNYGGVHASDTSLKAVDGMLSLSDEQLAELVQTSKIKLGVGLNLRKYTAPFLDAKIGQLSCLSIDQQARLLEVRARIAMFNEPRNWDRQG
jgi:hypothetical protein